MYDHQNITRLDIKNALKHREKQLLLIEKRKRNIYKELTFLNTQLGQEDLIRLISLKGKEVFADKLSPSNGSSQDIFQYLQRQYSEYQSYIQEFSMLLHDLECQEHFIIDVWNAAQKIDAKSYEYLYNVFVLDEKWTYVYEKYQISRATLSRELNGALDQIMELLHNKKKNSA